MPRSPDYNPSRHGTGWKTNEPSKSIVAFLDNPFVTDEQRMEVFTDNGVTPPPSLGGAIAVVETTPPVIERGVAFIPVKIINWVDITPEIYRRILTTNNPELTPRISEPEYDVRTPTLTTRPAPTVENSIVASFVPSEASDTTGIFGLTAE